MGQDQLESNLSDKIRDTSNGYLGQVQFEWAKMAEKLENELRDAKEETESLRLGMLGWGGHIAVLTEERDQLKKDYQAIKNKIERIRAKCEPLRDSVISTGDDILEIIEEDED